MLDAAANMITVCRLFANISYILIITTSSSQKEWRIIISENEKETSSSFLFSHHKKSYRRLSKQNKVLFLQFTDQEEPAIKLSAPAVILPHSNS
jgi:hypothetical protein